MNSSRRADDPMDPRKMEGGANSYEFMKSCNNSNVLNRLVRSEKARSYEFVTKNAKTHNF